MEWERELSEILDIADAKAFTTALVSEFEKVAKPTDEGYRCIGITLGRLTQIVSDGKVDINTALWMVFWLGAAWQKFCDDLEGDGLDS